MAMVLGVVTAATVAQGVAGVAAVAFAAWAVVSMVYPVQAKIRGGRFPSVGCCLTRFQGGPLVQIFYPADTESGGAPFLRKEVVQSVVRVYLNGMVPSWVLRLLTKRIGTCQAKVPPSKGEFPVIVFSHGLMGTLELYSTFCASLAAAGYVVVAPEHEDGSAMYACRAGSTACIPFKSYPKGFVNNRENMVEFRTPFMQQRIAELQVVLRGVMQDSAAPVAWTDVERSQLSEILARIDGDRIFLAGHSFGAATCLMALHEPAKFWSLGSTGKDCKAKRVVQPQGCLLFDLWGTAVPFDADGKAPGMQPCPLLLMISEEWVHNDLSMKVNVSLAKNLRAQAAGASRVVGPQWVKGSAHASLTNGPCAVPGWLGRLFNVCGKVPRDREYQCWADCSRAFLQAACKAAGKGVDSQALEDEFLADPLVSKDL